RCLGVRRATMRLPSGSSKRTTSPNCGLFIGGIIQDFNRELRRNTSPRIKVGLPADRGVESQRGQGAKGLEREMRCRTSLGNVTASAATKTANGKRLEVRRDKRLILFKRALQLHSSCANIVLISAVKADARRFVPGAFFIP